MAAKQCTRCKEWYPGTPEYFHRDKYKPDGITVRCKKCQCATKLRGYHEKQDKLKAKKRLNTRAKVREDIKTKGLAETIHRILNKES